MSPDAIKQLVIQTINSQMSAYSTAKVPYHTHNGVDSPPIQQPTFIYLGLIGLDGTIGILPNGWTVTYNGTGDYSITHNLNTFFYSVVASPTGLTADVDITTDNNTAEFSWFQAGTGTPQDTPFYFILTAISNKSIVPATYTATEYIKKGILV